MSAELNWKQDRVWLFLLERGAPMTIRQLARRCFPGVRPVAKADSQVRNSLRRLVRERLVRKVADGTYVGLERA